MDLLAATPTLDTAVFKFLDLGTGQPILTTKKKEMFVEIYAEGTKERQEATRQYSARNAKMFADKEIKVAADIPETGELKDFVDEFIKSNNHQLLEAITESCLVQIDGKESTSKKLFYATADFKIWFTKIDVFAAQHVNFIKA